MSSRKPTELNRPLRLLEKAIGGGLGTGNLGVFISSHGTGKRAVMTSIAIDKAMDSHNVLHVALGRSVSDIRAYRDEILNEIEKSLDLQDRAEILSAVERHTQIYTFRSGALNIPRLAQTLDFLADHAEFRPELIDLQGWPDWRTASPEELRALKRFAQDAGCQIWASVHTLPTDRFDARGVPDYVARIEDALSVMIALEPEKENIPIRFIKVHGGPVPQNLHLEFDPTTLLVRWR